MNNTIQQQEFLVGILKRAIAETDKMWNEQVSHAQIVGYLQGTMKAIISELDRNNTK